MASAQLGGRGEQQQTAMAANTSPIFVAADGTTPKDLVAAGSDGSKIRPYRRHQHRQQRRRAALVRA